METNRTHRGHGPRWYTAVGLAAAAVAAPLTALACTAPAAAGATPPETGCPAGDQTLTVAWLEQQGPYKAPPQIDSAGNQDGLVCGHVVSAAAAANYCGGPCVVPVLYTFRDNDLTPEH